MDDKVFDLLTKLYSEVQEMKSEMKDGFVKLGNGQTQLEDRLEYTRKILFDGYKQNAEQINEVKNIVTDLSDKVEKHQVEIRVIKGGKLKAK